MRECPVLLRPAILAAGLLMLFASAGAASAQTPFSCTGEAFIIQDAMAQLTQIDQTTTPFTFVNIGGANAGEINNLGFRRADGFLYGAALTMSPNGNTGLVRIDSTGAVTALGSPAALPTNVRFAAGDVSPDSTTMYLNASGTGILYRVALPALTTTQVNITGAAGVVFDWAVSPVDGLLYGGDQTGAAGAGQLAILNPTTGVRADSAVTGCTPVTATCTEATFPAGTAYGGAWFNAAGNLFLYRNNGVIYEIDLTGPTVVSTQSGPGSTLNDGAACVQDVIGAAKQMFSTSMGVPATVTIDYVFENLGIETLNNLTADEDLSAVFGTHGVGMGVGDWEFVSITSDDANFHNPSFNGHSVTELIDSGETLTAGEVRTIQVTLTLKTIDAAVPNPPGPDEYVNQILFEGDNPSGTTFGDLSTSEDDVGGNPNPDPDGNGSPDERTPAVITVDQVPVELIEFAID